MAAGEIVSQVEQIIQPAMACMVTSVVTAATKQILGDFAIKEILCDFVTIVMKRGSLSDWPKLTSWTLHCIV